MADPEHRLDSQGKRKKPGVIYGFNIKPAPPVVFNREMDLWNPVARLSIVMGECWFRKFIKRPRRFLRIRHANGRCEYFFWTHPRRGERVDHLRNSFVLRDISKDEAIKHYSTNGPQR